MKSWIWPDKKKITLLVALLMGYANWLALRPSLSLFNWEAVGWISFGLTLTYLAKGEPGDYPAVPAEQSVSKDHFIPGLNRLP